MEVEKRIQELEIERTTHLKIIDDINAEKLALDQMLIDALKQMLAARKECILANASLNKANNEIDRLTSEINCLKNIDIDSADDHFKVVNE